MLLILCSVLILGSVSYVPICHASEPTVEAATDKQEDCTGAYRDNGRDEDTSPAASGMFDDDILFGMNKFMREIHKTLSKPLMIGHSLMCYAADVAYTCVGDGICLFKIYNLNFFISGMIIYIVGILMTMSIGMYFVDISFKLGFAVLFMPVSIGLWPFPPTKNKFSENLSIVIRNGMLFTLVAIGVSFAVTLIDSSLFDGKHGMSGEQDFWTAIATSNTELLTQNFAFDDFHFIIIGFGLLFAFKILASSVNDYLNYFFSDAVFGSESPMHHLGTQAVGMVAANTVKPVASFVGDVAKTQTGRAISGLGSGILSLATKGGRKEMADNIKSNYKAVKKAVTNPRATFNSAMTSVEDTAKKASASGVKGVFNSASLLLPIKESSRRNLEKKFDEWADDNIAHGKLRNLAADTAAFGANTYNQLIRKKNAKFVTRDDVKGTIEESLNSVKEDLSNLHGDKLKENVKTGIVKAATKINNEIQEYRDNPDGIMDEKEMRDALHKGKELGKTLANIAGDKAEKVGKSALASVYNQVHMMAGTGHALKNTDNVVDAIKQDAQTIKENVQKLTQSEFAQETVKAWKESDKAPITLQPSAVASAALHMTAGTVKAPFKLVGGTLKGAYNLTFHRKETWDNIKKIAAATKSNVENTIDEAKQLKDALSTGEGRKIILKKSGQVVLRTVVGTTARTLKGTGEETASVLGKALKNFGQSLQQNGGNKKGRGYTSWQELQERQEDKKEQSQASRDYFSSLSDKYDE